MAPRLFCAGLALLLSLGAAESSAAQGRGGDQMRFRGMDRNGDGVITRAEWRGSDQSFRVHDWNGDGVLSGDEVRPGAYRRGRPMDEEDLDDSGQHTFSDWTERRFADLDHDRDGRLTWAEWHFDRESFRRADHNGDGSISKAEFLGFDEDDDRDDRFRNLDLNRDGVVSSEEWHGSVTRFRALDRNHDGRLTRAEAIGTEEPVDLFASLDVNRDGLISLNEWHWARANFERRDADRSGTLTRPEFGRGETGRPLDVSSSRRAGYDRGLLEGRVAGREDRERNQGWDLEGQRELERADSGYEPSRGPLAEYQTGYREGFRRGYREGYGPRE